MIVPRAVARGLRLSAYVSRYGWLGWRTFAMRIPDPERRESVLAAFAPFLLTALLILWTWFLIAGYGLMFYGLRADLRPTPSLGGALYFAGTTLITIGYGDIVPEGPAARLLSVVTGATGFATVAIVTSYLFATFGAFQAREIFVVAMRARTGAPASGIELLETAAELGVRQGLGGVFDRGQTWASAVLETHLAYPILTYFRANHNHQSWVATLGALLDAATLLISSVEGEHGEARLMYRVGYHLVDDMGRYIGLPSDDAVGIERHEFDTVHARLAAAGYPISDRDAAWKMFTGMRGMYSSSLNALAHFF